MRDPVLDLAFEAGSHVQSVSFSSDGLIYAEVEQTTTNAWTVLVHFWPEVLGGALALAMLIVLVRVVKVARRPRVKGRPYCRRCDYDLSAAEGACPECGGSRVRIGVTRRRRLVTPLATAAILCAGYGALHAFGVGRTNAASNWIDWSSTRLTAYAQDNTIVWLIAHQQVERRLIEIDPATGRMRSVRRLASATAIDLSISPGAPVGVTTLEDGALGAINLRSGRIIKRQPRLDDGRVATNTWSKAAWRHVAGWLDDDRVAVQFFDSAAGSKTLYAWNVRTGELEELFAVPMPSRIAGGDRRDSVRVMQVLPGARYAMEIPDWSVARHESPPTTFLVRDVAGGEPVGALQIEAWEGAWPVALNETSCFIRGPELELWSLGEGLVRTLELRQVPRFRRDGPGGLTCDPVRRRLYVAAGGDVSVYDVERNRWIAMLEHGHRASAGGGISVSRDGRWVSYVINEMVPGAGRMGVTRLPHVLVFEMGE